MLSSAHRQKCKCAHRVAGAPSSVGVSDAQALVPITGPPYTQAVYVNTADVYVQCNASTLLSLISFPASDQLKGSMPVVLIGWSVLSVMMGEALPSVCLACCDAFYIAVRFSVPHIELPIPGQPAFHQLPPVSIRCVYICFL